MLKFLVFLLVSIILLIGMPFIGFDNKDYIEICADAAKYFGIDVDEYEVEFTKGKVVNASGEEVNGTITTTGEVYTIRVQKSFSRTFTVGVIFHEFAHAAQHKYNMDTGEYTKEQHAELLSFDVMWRSNYWWNAVHLIFMHSVHAKPSDYLAPKQIWNAVLTGNHAVTASW